MKDCALCRLVTKVLSMSWTVILLRTRNAERTRYVTPTVVSQGAIRIGDSRRRQWKLEVILDSNRKELNHSQKKIYPSTSTGGFDIHKVADEGGVFALGRTYDARMLRPRLRHQV